MGATHTDPAIPRDTPGIDIYIYIYICLLDLPRELTNSARIGRNALWRGASGSRKEGREKETDVAMRARSRTGRDACGAGHPLGHRLRRDVARDAAAIATQSRNRLAEADHNRAR